MATRETRTFQSHRGRGFVTDLGRQETPSAIPELDFTTLDRALQLESTLADKAIETVTKNLEQMGNIRDEVTGIEVATPRHAAQLKEVQVAHGLDEGAYVTALRDINNPTAMYDLDRKVKKVMSDPVIRKIQQETVMIDHFRQNLHTIGDPGLRAEAAKDLVKVMDDETGDFTAENLSLEQYQPIDVAGMYRKVLDNLAPGSQTSEIRRDENGESYVYEATVRDKDAMEQARRVFMENPIVAANLRARGIIDDEGNPIPTSDGQSFFDIIEGGMAVADENISYYTNRTGRNPGDPNVTPNAQLFENWQPNIIQSKAGNEFDLGMITLLETSNSRQPDDLVHVDKGNDSINLGSYSYNGGPSGGAKPFLEWLQNKFPSNSNIRSLLDPDQVNLRSSKSLEKARTLYMNLQSQIGEERLTNFEHEFAMMQYGDPAVQIAKNAGLDNLTLGERTLLMDVAIQFGNDDVQRWVKAYANDSEGEDLIDYIIRVRSNYKNGKYAQRAVNSGAAARALDKANQQSQGQEGGNVNPLNELGLNDNTATESVDTSALEELGLDLE